MKKLLLTITAVTLLFAACKKDDNNNNGGSTSTTEDLLVGTWLVTDISGSGNVQVPNFGTVPFTLQSDSISSTSYFESTKNPNNLDYNIDAQMNVIILTQATPVPYARSGSGTWTLVGEDSLHVVRDGAETEKYEIIQLTSSKLRLRTNQEMEYAGQTAEAEVEILLEK